MQPVDGEFEASDEVDAVRWVDLDVAADHLTYTHDASVVESLRHHLEIRRETSARSTSRWATRVTRLVPG